MILLPLLAPAAVLAPTPALPALPITQANYRTWLRVLPPESGRVYAVLRADLKPAKGPFLPEGCLLYGDLREDGTIVLVEAITNDTLIPIVPLHLRLDGRPPADLPPEEPEPGPQEEPPPAAEVEPQAAAGIWIQVLAADRQAFAESAAERLSRLLKVPLQVVEGHPARERTVFRIRSGPYPDLPAAKTELKRIRQWVQTLRLRPFLTREP